MSKETEVQEVQESETQETETQETQETQEPELKLSPTELELLRTVNALNEKIAGMEADLKAQKNPPLTEEDIIKDLEKDNPKSPDLSKIDIEQLSNAELAGLILSEVERAFFTPVVHRVELLRVREELKEAKNKYSDFDEYKNETHKIASANPSLSIEDSYLMAKAKAGKLVAKPEEKVPSKVVDLEDAKKAKEAPKVPQGATGTKPVQTPASVEQTNPKNLDEAVQLAFKKVFKEK